MRAANPTARVTPDARARSPPGPIARANVSPAPAPDRPREYHCRKNRNEGKGDAVYNNLAYLPVCNCMPVCRSGCRNPTWMWTKKENATGR